MKRRNVRFVLYGLLVTLLLSVVCLTAAPAQAASLKQDSNGYYLIYNADDLYTFADMVNSGNNGISGRLMKNIVVNKNVLKSDGSLNGDGSDFRLWTPIGVDYDVSFTGTFDGNSKTVFGLYFDDNGAHCVGLFGFVTNGTVKNLTVSDSYFRALDYVGGVVGYSDQATVADCINSSSVTSQTFTGGIVGYSYTRETSSYVENCSNSGYVSGLQFIGGVVGRCWSDSKRHSYVSNCSNTGTVSGEYCIGGVVGNNSDGEVRNCYNIGTVFGADTVGGVIGFHNGYYDNAEATNCYHTGIVQGSYYIGGITGGISRAAIANCYNIGKIQGTTVVGGIIGSCFEGTVTSCYNSEAVRRDPDEHCGSIVGYLSNSTVSYCYYLSDMANTGIGYKENSTVTKSGAKNANQFSSGEVAYLLNNSTQAWYQTIGTQATPQFEGKTVYIITDCQGGTSYVNYKKGAPHVYGGDFVCDLCGNECSHTYHKGTCCSCGVTPTPVTLTKEPVSASAYNGRTAKVTVSAKGDGLTYEWYYANKGSSMFTYTSSFKGSTYSLSMTEARSGRRVYCVVTDKYGNSVQTKTVTLTLRTWMKITKQPVSVSAYNGKSVKVTVGVKGDGLTYKWYYANPDSDKFTYTSTYKGNSYGVTMNAARNGRRVYCVITDAYGRSVTTKTVTLSMRTWMKITKQPVSVTAASGKTAKVTVGIQGDGLTYKWYYANPGSNTFKLTTSFTGKSYSISMTAARSGRRVYCVITDKYGRSVKTDIVTLKMK